VKWHNSKESLPEPGRRVALCWVYEGTVATECGTVFFETDEYLIDKYPIVEEDGETEANQKWTFMDNGDAKRGGVVWCTYSDRFQLHDADSGHDYTDGYEVFHDVDWTYGLDDRRVK